MALDLTPTQRRENKKLQNDLRMRKDNGEQGLMIRGGDNQDYQPQQGSPPRVYVKLWSYVVLLLVQATIVFRINNITQKHKTPIPFQV